LLDGEGNPPKKGGEKDGHDRPCVGGKNGASAGERRDIGKGGSIIPGQERGWRGERRHKNRTQRANKRRT